MPILKTSSAVELLVELDRASPEPLHRQLEQAVRDAIRNGRIEAGTVLPSSRALALQLGVSRGIVVEAFEQLVAEGYVTSRPGGSTRVAAPAAEGPRRAAIPEVVTYRFDFRPGRPDVGEFPRAVWLRSLRRILAEAPSERLTYGSGHGVPELRIALAGYLNRVRGTAAHPADVVIASGFAQGLALVLRVLALDGIRVVAVEDPSDPEYRAAIEAAGLRWVGIPVDEDGLSVDHLAASDAGAVLVTAAHQYPTGAVLSAARRTMLLAWADSAGAIVIEDDYDAEFRYDREPIGALQGLRPDRVIYAGSASKVLAPGLRLGWLVLPDNLVERVAAVKVAADMGSAALDQLAFADVLARGELDRHLRRMRPIYRRRRDALLAAIRTHLPELRPEGASAGLHVLACLPAHLGIDDAAVVEAAAAAGIGIGGLATRRIAAGPPGLVFGYGAIDDPSIDAGVRALAAVIDGLRSRGTVVGSPPTDRPVVGVYGTLRRGEANHRLMAGAEPLGRARVAGHLFGLGPTDDRAYRFPAFLPGPGGSVVVELYRLPDGATLDRLDRLEAYAPEDEARSEYLRRSEPIVDGPVAAAWVYRFAGDLPATAEPIPDGDWVAWSAGRDESIAHDVGSDR